MTGACPDMVAADQGSYRIIELQTTERVEPSIIRGLEAAGSRLWADRSLAVPGQFHFFASPLLPIARWRLDPPGPHFPLPETATPLDAFLETRKAWRDREV
jgi:hypothetical protein